jgi:hypothetical protein
VDLASLDAGVEIARRAPPDIPSERPIDREEHDMFGGERPLRARTAAALLAAILFAVGCGADDPSSAMSPDGPSTGAPDPGATETSSGAPSSTGSEVTSIDGDYHVTVTAADARAAGIAPGRFSDFVGEYQLQLARGQIIVYFTHTITLDLLRGTYTVEGHRLRLVSDDGSLHQMYGWSLDRRLLRLTLLRTDQPDVRVYDELIFTSHPWEQTS